MRHLRRLALEKAINVRDLGGYPTADGGVTPFGRFYRSDNMSGLTRGDMDKLLEAGVRTVVDLRTPGEVREFPNCFEGEPEVTVEYCSLLGESTENFTGNAQSGFLRSLGESYTAMISRDASYFQELFQILARGVKRGAVLFHCTAGKDRTGVTAALLLELAGVYDVDIIADYTLTQVYLKEKVLRYIANSPSTPVEIFSAKDTSMETFLQVLHTQYAGARAYLRGVGVPDDSIEALWGDSLH